MFRTPLPSYSPDLLLALAQGDLPRLVLVSDTSGVRWARPEEGPKEAPPFAVPPDVLAALRQAASANGIGADGIVTVEGRAMRLAAVHQDGAYVVALVEAGSADMWTPPHGGHTTTK